MTNKEYLERVDSIVIKTAGWKPGKGSGKEVAQAIDQLVDDAIQYTVDDINSMAKEDGHQYGIINHPYGTQRKIVEGA